MEALRGRPYLVVSSDGHAGPSLERQLREYCPKSHLDEFDRYAREIRARQGDGFWDRVPTGAAREAFERTRTCAGLQDPHARLRDMDAEGVVADVIFAGGQNDEELPFVGFGSHAGPAGTSPELLELGGHIWNLWLADYVSAAPERLIGVMQAPISNLPAAIKEIEWGHDAGLRAMNFPAPRSDYPPYSDPVYDSLWAVCEERRIPLLTHAGGGEQPLGSNGPGRKSIFRSEVHWLSRRSLWQMIFGGVFDRFPGLKVVFTEQRVAWVPETLRDLDSIYSNDMFQDLDVEGRRVDNADLIQHAPSEYWRRNCFVGGSFLARYEVAMRHEVGLRNLMWGSDYPHVEGTWPWSRLSMRYTFHDVPEDETRLILGENAVDVYGLDRDRLRPIADEIGPHPSEIAAPVDDDELPAFRGEAFRTIGAFH